jgi:SHS2 domain-containing protein
LFHKKLCVQPAYQPVLLQHGFNFLMDVTSPTSYFEHDADIGVIGRGATLEQAFEAAAQAVFAVITPLDGVRTQTTVSIEFEEADQELALVIWLNLLLGKARELGVVFSRFHLQRRGDKWNGVVSGEKWNDSMERGVEVKGATLTMLAVELTGSTWEVRCVVDV